MFKTGGDMVTLRAMLWAKPFRGVEPRIAWLRGVLLASCGVSLLASAPLWINAREFPVLPITPGFPSLPAPWDQWFFGAMLLSLVLAIWFYRPAVTMFLVAGFFAFCEDQNRSQPWFYMYWVMLLLTLWPESIALAACRWSISVVYVWSGIQKCSPHFFGGVPAWFVAPAADWHWPGIVIDLLRWAVTATPFVEIGIGLALWSKRFRVAAIAAVIVVHGSALLFLGPLGRNYNWIVWPWNGAMIALVLVLFAPFSNARQALADLRRSRTALGLVALYGLLPILSYVGLWDSYFSFALYAENAATANFFVTPAYADRLPPGIRSYVHPFPQAYDPQFQGPLVLMYNTWCYKELHVTFIPEPRVYHALFLALRTYSQEPGDLRLIIGPRFGPVQFYEGDRRQLLTPK
jgi:hypothetical protein